MNHQETRNTIFAWVASPLIFQRTRQRKEQTQIARVQWVHARATRDQEAAENNVGKNKGGKFKVGLGKEVRSAGGDLLVVALFWCRWVAVS